MTPTRLSKIARLPANIREELNRRLHDGKLSNHILPWVNSLPETKEVLAELFNSKPITHQNLSEWRRAGYQDWLFHQQRLEWFTHFTEQSSDIEKHDGCPDTFETMANVFLYEIAQGINIMKATKSPNERCDRLEKLIREFSRLQNAYNWSRRVELDYAKHNHSRPAVPSVNLGPPAPVAPELCGGGSRRQAAMESDPAPNSLTPKLPNSQTPETPSSFCIQSSALAEPEPQRAGALQDASLDSDATEPRASVPDCGSPLPLSDRNSFLSAIASATAETPKPLGAPKPGEGGLNSQTPPSSQPIPALAPPTQLLTPNSYLPIQPPRPYKVHSIPTRGRRFTCVEG